MSMIKWVKSAIAILPSGIQRSIYWRKNRLTRNSILKEWESHGRYIPPPPQYKQFVVEQVSKKYGFNIFVETGTLFGDMIEAQRNNFLRLYSIEIEPKLFSDAVKYFMPYKHIKIINGDSSFKLEEVLKEIPNESVLFWLDGHYSGGITGKGEKECPVYEELETIFKFRLPAKYILIDDARCFDGTGDYPTIKDLTDYVQKKENGLKVETLNDIIHIH